MLSEAIWTLAVEASDGVNTEELAVVLLCWALIQILMQKKQGMQTNLA